MHLLIRKDLPVRQRKLSISFLAKASLLFVSAFCFLAAFSQEQSLVYAVQRKGKKIGDLTFQKSQAGSRTTYNIQSDVKVSLLLTISVKAKEQSVYENDVLQSVSVIRHINGKQKTNRQIVNNGKGLVVTEDGEKRELKNYVVNFNIHCLYTVEPTYFTNVFSDSFQQFLPIVKMAPHHYKITFPDGNSNEYFYENGVCQKVKVENRLFNAEFLLTSL